MRTALRSIALACAYYATGKLGLLLAVPPGYATTIWPPSGIAIGSLLLFGPNLWPGVFLGSFILNGVISQAWSVTGGFVLPKVLIAAGIAIGSTLQALGVRALIQRTMRLPIELSSWRDVVLLLALCGPLGCVIAASCGVLTLLAGGILPAAKVAHNWLTWWGGDLFGVVVFLPLMLTLPGAPTRLRWRGHALGALPVAGLLILLLSLGVTFYAWKLVAHSVYEKNAAEFSALAQESEKALQHRIDSYQQVLWGGVGFFRGAESVSRAQWRTYVEAIDTPHNFPGITGLGWIADVPSSDIPAFVEKMRREGQVGFAVHPAGDEGDHFVVSYLEPLELNREAVGLNIAFERHRYNAALLARDNAEPVITTAISLVQARGRGPGFLMLVPIFDREHEGSPRGIFRGWISAPVLAQGLLSGLTNAQGRALHLQVFDEDEGQNELFYDSNAGTAGTEAAYSVREILHVGHRNWIVSWTSTPEFERARGNAEPTLVLSSGVLLTFLLGGIVMMLARRAKTVEHLVQQKTQQLLENETRYQTLVDAVTDYAIYRLDVRGLVRSWNTGAHMLKGYRADEILGQPFARFFDAEARARGEPARILSCAQAAGRYASEGWRVRKDGSRFWATFVIHALRNAQGELIGFAKVVRDATQQQAVDRLKREFISTVSHELRTPLTSIRGSLGLIDAGVLGKLPERAQSMLKIAHQNCERLVRIINDILDIEKIESGKLELRPQALPVGSLLQQAVEANESYGQKYQVGFVLEAFPGGAYVCADPDRLQQVMSNLLSNAAKFSPAGRQVFVRALAGPERIRFEVQDHGAGIPEEFRARIFEKFAQADSSASRRFDGTGLGLSITQQLVHAMRGTIGFDSVVGQGTTFHFELPRAAPPATLTGEGELVESHPGVCSAGSPGRPSDHLPRVLHIEDDPDLTNILSTALANKADVVSAQSLQAARKLLGRHSFALVVLDPGLPDGDGLELLDELPRLAAPAPPVVILSVTEMSQEVRQRVHAVLVKSRISEARIAEVILSVLSPGPQGEAAETRHTLLPVSSAINSPP
jgi:PAS domain S-box-containing protein